jgi:UDPglucose 6-dehydrogenase
MDVFSSSSPSEGTSEGSRSCSTGPTTPSASPLFRPSEFDDLKLAALSQSRVLSETELPRIAVKNICVVGAGYVGRSHPSRDSAAAFTVAVGA